MRKFLFLILGLLAFKAQAEIVEFKLKTENQTCKGLSQVVISQDKKVLYHIEVPMYGTGQVHLLTGNYQIDVISKDNCVYQNVIQISDIPNKMLEVKMVKDARQPATTAMSPEVWGMYNRGGNDYPHSGNVAMGKPKLYISGKDEGKFKLKFTSEDFNFLATVPSFKGKEIVGELRQGSIYSENTLYPYLFYDARVDDENFQSNQGFCGTRKEIFQFMIDGLKKYEFPEAAKTDFGNDWAAKIPEALKYCVYPQLNAQLDKVAPFEFTFDDKSEVRTERVFYLVIPQGIKGQRIPTKENRFSGKPKSQWKHYTHTVMPKMPYLYEWGVGFMFE